MKADVVFQHGLLRRELFMGMVSAVSASHARVNLRTAGEPSGSHFESFRYGRGEVGEFVLIEGQTSLVLGKLVEVRLPETERKGLALERASNDVIGNIQFLGAVRSDSLQVTPGVATYPRLGDRVYGAPHEFVSRIPSLMERSSEKDAPITLRLGRIGGSNGSELSARPERLFGRHCAVLGATGGGKSWTLARLIEECSRYEAKLILFDATGEYRSLDAGHVRHCHIGTPHQLGKGSLECSLPPRAFQESDFFALFEPSERSQGPKLRAAVRSLRIASHVKSLAPSGLLLKANRTRKPIEILYEKYSDVAEDPRAPFSVEHLSRQVLEECVWPTGRPNTDCYGSYDESAQSYCLPLVTRIDAYVRSAALACVFRPDIFSYDLDDIISQFIDDQKHRVLRLCLSGLRPEFRARELIVNAIGRILLDWARSGRFRGRPLLAFLDEAHNFLGRSIGTEDSAVKLDAFELIAREGRKFGLNICLASQRPRDLTEGVLSQMGTLIVHRLTNDRDRDIVERSCGEIDRSASAFLPNLKPGEAIIIGADFPIPLAVQIMQPTTTPISDGPDYQRGWVIPHALSGASSLGSSRGTPQPSSNDEPSVR